MSLRYGLGSNQDPDDWHAQKVDREREADEASQEKEKTMILLNEYPGAPGYQNTDTSAAAAQAVSHEAEALREQCLNLLQANNLTADEVADMLRRSVLSIRPRISELNRRGLVRDSGQRRKNASGHGAIVWTTRDL